ncbi:MAG TPA: hypothetical protein VE130_11425 [Nitrososphaeraceae archaeon]|jgi:hypothetical protein|nr:hypothetical protein [Nitrososphaeraceae archaeon]
MKKSVFESNIHSVVVTAAAIVLVTTPFISTSIMVDAQNESWTSSYNIKDCNFSTTGTNPYFILEPGYQLVFAGVEDGEPLNVTVTVSNETKVVGDEIVTRAVEERVVNSETGDLLELTKDYFAICKQTNSVFYFGEDVNNYENSKLIDHEGSWLHGSNNATAGLIMPGTILLGSRYYQEIAPDVALDKAEIVSMNQTANVPAGNFSNVIKMIETSDLEPGIEEDNLHAKGVGQVIDNELELMHYGYEDG